MWRKLLHPMVPFVVVAMGALYAQVAFVLEGADVPRADDYLEAERVARADGFDPARDTFAVLPAWSLRPAVHIEAPFLPSDDLATQPLERYRRLYVLVEPDGEAEAARFLQQHPQARAVSTSGRVQLIRRDENAAVTFDFRARLADAAVQLTSQKDGTRRAACTTPHPGGVRCDGRDKWQRVNREWRLVTENGAEVVFAHPPKKDERVDIRFEQVILGDELAVRAGFVREGAGTKSDPVILAILIDGREVARYERPRAFDFGTFRLDTSAYAGEGRVVTFQVFTTGKNDRGHFAFDAFAFRRGAEAR